METGKMLETLCNIPAVSGFEVYTAEQVAALLRPLCDQVETDALGNVTGLLSCGKENAKTVLLDAHFDQIGFVVTEVLEGGFLRFSPVGGVDPRMLLAGEVTVLADPPLFGVVASQPPHLQKAGDSNKATPISEMLVDTGLTDAKAQVSIGTPIIFGKPPLFLQNDVMASRCLDDRAGIVAILYALEKLQHVDRQVNIAVLISAQEEESGVGASAGAFRLQPEYGIAIDVTHGKTADGPSEGTFALGCGSVIGMGPNMHRGLTNMLIQTAKEKGMPYELEIMEGNTGTNAWTMQIVGRGIAMAIVSIPLRYMHTPIETLKIADVESVGDLLAAFLQQFDGEVTA